MAVAFPNPEPKEADVLVERLAAVRAALDTGRRAWRNDILITASVETLARRGSLTVRGLCRALNESWRTDALTDPLVAAALDEAYHANLVRREYDLSETERWTVTQAAATESAQDRQWAEDIISAFERQVAERLDAMPDDRLDADRAARVTRHVYAALAYGADGMYALAPVGVDPERLRPLGFDLAQIRRYVQDNVEPKSVRDAALELATAAVDPDDAFGNDVVRLLTIGNLLYAFLTRRDVPVKPDLTGHRLLLDTSTLVQLVEDGTPEQEMVENLISMSLRLGVEVLVAHHTLEEWERVWEGAKGEALNAAVPVRLPGMAHRLAGNPFVRAWVHGLEADPSLTWYEFERRHRDIRRRLAGLGVFTRGHGNKSAADRATVEAIKTRMLGLVSEAEARGRRAQRSVTSAAADAESCAMVMRWRSRPEIGPTGAYFIARETLTGRAHRDLFDGPDYLPVTVPPATWVMYVAALTTEDPAERGHLAEMVADATVRSSFFGMANGFTLDEVLTLSDQLCQGSDELSVEDTRTAIQSELFGLLEETTGEHTAVRKGSAVNQRRTARRDARILREQQRLDERVDKVRQEKDAVIASTEAQKAELAGERDDERGRRVQAEEDRDVAYERGEQLVRALKAGGTGAAFLVTIVVLALTGVLTGWILAVALGLLGLYSVRAYQYATDLSKSGASLVLEALAEVGFLLVIEVGASRL